jgi:hypothetical protein
MSEGNVEIVRRGYENFIELEVEALHDAGPKVVAVSVDGQFIDSLCRSGRGRGIS